MRSEPFAAPQTGRLTISVWLKTLDGVAQPQIRLALEGSPRFRPFSKLALLGGGPGAKPIPSQWQQFIFEIDDLPPDVPPQLDFRVDLLGAGDVWIDHVQLFDLFFSDAEKIQLSKIITRAELQLNSGRYGDCLYDLEGYWPRLLNAQVPLPVVPLVANPATVPPTAPKDPADKSANRPILNRIKDAWKF